MRFRVTLAPFPDDTGRRPLLRYDYQYSIASGIYHLLINADESYRDLHHSDSFKFFTFSRLEIPERKALKNGLLILSNDAYLWFSSPNRQLTETLARQLVSEESMRFGGVDFAIVEMAMLPPVEMTDQESFSTMSPVILRTVIDTPEGTKTWDIAPDENRFDERLCDNLVTKYQEYNSDKGMNNLEVVLKENMKQTRLQIRDTFHRAHLMEITLKGNPEILQFAYECGLGEKNSMGFGMVRLAGGS